MLTHDIEKCMDSFLCSAHEQVMADVNRRIRRIQALLRRTLTDGVAKLVLAHTSGIVAMCGALSERPMECVEDAVQSYFENTTLTHAVT